MIVINAKKIVILIIFLIFISSSFLLAAQPRLEEIQGLINQGKTEEALNILNSSDLNSDPDLKFYQALLLSWQEDYEKSELLLLELIESYPERLDFYNQLGRIYGWQRKFSRAEEILEKAQELDYASERTAILAQQAEWQGNYYEAKRLIKEAIIKAESTELEAEYRETLDRLNNELQAEFYLEGKALYSESDKEDLEFAFGIEKDLKDGLNFNAAAGANYFQDQSNFIFKSKLELDQPIILDKTAFSSEILYYSGESRDKYELNNNFDYLINSKNILGVNYNFLEDNTGSDYQSLELEYEHQFKKIIMVLKNTSRNYDAGWDADFSQHIDLYYPHKNYLLNLSLSHYDGGEYILRAGVDFSDLFSGRLINLSRLNLWLNDKKTANLNFRLDLK